MIIVPGIPPNTFGDHSTGRPVSCSASIIACAVARHWSVSPPASVRPPNVVEAKNPTATRSRNPTQSACWTHSGRVSHHDTSRATGPARRTRLRDFHTSFPSRGAGRFALLGERLGRDLAIGR